MAKKLNYINSNFFQKVYILDFYYNDLIDTTYAFSVPPQSEDFAYTQRIGETKTFGGVIYEDYGNEAVKITLSGSTINKEVKCVFTHNNNLKTYSDYEEIVELKKIIQKYGEIKNLDGKKILLTDLSSGDNWEVVINELQVKRSKESPLSYNYTIVFTGIPQTVKQKAKKNKKKVDVKDNNIELLQEELKEAEKATQSFWNMTADSFSSAMMNKFGLSNRIASATDKIKKANKVVSGYIDLIKAVIDSTNISNLVDVYKSAKDLITEGYRLVFDNAAKVYNAVLDYGLDMIDTVRFFRKELDMPNGGIFNPNNLNPGFLKQFSDSTENFMDEWTVFMDEIETIVNKCIVLAKGVCEYGMVVNPGAIGENDELVPIYGYREVVVKDSDTWETLANQYLHSTDYAGLLAVYNKDVTLQAGVTIFIPTLEEMKSENTENLIYNKADVKDNYGVDLIITNGDLKLQNNDLMPVKGIENLNQAIDNRLSSEMDSRIRLSVYGIKKAIGKNNTALVFLKNSIEETVLADPRIEEVNDIKIEGSGDNVAVSFTYRDINKKEINYGGIY